MDEGTLDILIIVVFVVLLLLSIILFKRLMKQSPANEWHASFKALAEELNASVKKNIMTGTFEGLSFKCSRVPFWIQLDFPIPLQLSIKKAYGIEKLWKKLGLVQSINTRDESFDTAFAVRTNNREIAQKILQNDNCREPIKKLFTLLTARHILIANKKIRDNFKTPGGFSIKAVEAIAKKQSEMIKESLHQLSQLNHHTATAEELVLTAETESPGQVIIRVINLTIWVIVMIGLVLITVGLSQYEPLENFLSPAFKFMLPYLILFTAITLFRQYLKLKKSNYLRLEVLETLVSCLIVYMFSGMGYFLFTNGYLDNSPEIKNIVSVQDKSKSGRDYFIYFQLSDKGKKETSIEVSESFYKSVKTGDPIIIIYKQGYHQIRWLVSYEKGNP